MVVGGGHNGLVAAAYLARAGRSVLVLERRPQVGGAAVSQQVFEGVDVRLSAYSYLVSLLPDRIVADLGLDVRLADRSVASYTALLARRPVGRAAGRARRGPRHGDVLPALTGSDAEFAGWQRFYGRLADPRRGPRAHPHRAAAGRRRPGRPAARPAALARPPRAAAGRRRRRPPQRRRRPRDRPHRRPDRHLRRRARRRRAGRALLPVPPGRQRHRPLAGAGRRHGRGQRRHGGRRPPGRRRPGHPGHGHRPRPRADGVTVHWTDDDGGRARGRRRPRRLRCRADRAAELTGADAGPRPSGSQLKVNMVLARLPRLRSGTDPATAFAGTFHVDEAAAQIDAAYAQAAAGRLPDVIPFEVYCHSLTDPSILGPVERATGHHTLTLFGLHTPAELYRDDPVGTRRRRSGGWSPSWTPTWRSRCWTAWPGRRRRALPAGGLPAGRRGVPGHAGRAHLPRRPVLAGRGDDRTRSAPGVSRRTTRGSWPPPPAGRSAAGRSAAWVATRPPATCSTRVEPWPAGPGGHGCHHGPRVHCRRALV